MLKQDVKYIGEITDQELCDATVDGVFAIKIAEFPDQTFYLPAGGRPEFKIGDRLEIISNGKGFNIEKAYSTMV